MSELLLPEKLVPIAESARITSENVRTIRRDVFTDDLVSRKEAESLLALDLTARVKCPEWTSFFVEALVNHIVYQADPEGVISDDNAQWLINCIGRNGIVDSPQRFEMLVKVLETARTAPEFLQIYALKQVSHAILNNQGPVCVTREASPYVICEQDVSLLRRLLFAYGGEGGLAITRVEAEILFELNDKTRANENAPSWNDLFVKSIANHLMSALGSPVPNRVFSLQENENNHQNEGGYNFFTTLAGSLRMVFAPEQSAIGPGEAAITTYNRAYEAAIKEAEKLTAEETNWVFDRIGRDGIVHKNEVALLMFLAEEGGPLPEHLQTMLDQAA